MYKFYIYQKKYVFHFFFIYTIINNSWAIWNLSGNLIDWRGKLKNASVYNFSFVLFFLYIPAAQNIYRVSCVQCSFLCSSLERRRKCIIFQYSSVKRHWGLAWITRGWISQSQGGGIKGFKTKRSQGTVLDGGASFEILPNRLFHSIRIELSQ